MRELIFVWIVMNFIVLFITVVDSYYERDIFYCPSWGLVWKLAPLNLAGKVICCVLVGALLFPADVFWLSFIALIRIVRHLGYALWWIFAADRLDVQQRWSNFWGDRDIYYCWKEMEL